MLQRIQTLYLLIASVSMLLASIFPLARFIMLNGDVVIFKAMGIYVNGYLNFSTWALMVIGAITSLLAVFTIFLYKGRLLQIRLTIFNTLIMVGFYIFAGFLFFKIVNSQEIERLWVDFAAFFPLVAIVVNILAIRRIYADEALVRSLSRLR